MGSAQVRKLALRGVSCVIAGSVRVGLGDSCKLQNGALVYEPAVLGVGFFVGPGAALTTDLPPAAANPDGTLKSAADWDAVGMTVDRDVPRLLLGHWVWRPCIMDNGGSGSRGQERRQTFFCCAGSSSSCRRVGCAGQVPSLLDGVCLCPVTGDTHCEQDGELVMSEGVPL